MKADGKAGGIGHIANRDGTFLGEWRDVPWVGRSVASGHGRRLILLFVGLSLIATALSFAGGGACLSFVIKSDDQVTQPIRSGWVSDLNGATLYLIASTMFVLVSIKLCVATARAFHGRELEGKLQLPNAVGGDKALAALARRNERIFRPLLRGLVVVSIVAIGFQQITTIHAARDYAHGTTKPEKPPILGWAETPYFLDVLARFDRDTDSLEQLLPQAEAKTMVGKALTTEARCGKTAVVGAGLIAMWAFIITASLLEALLIALVVWLLCKIVWLLSLMPRMLAGKEQANGDQDGLALELVWSDPQERYGLAAFDAMYNSILVVTTLAGLGFDFMLITNEERGSGLRQMEVLAWFGAALSAALILALPVLLVGTKADDLRQEELDQLQVRKRAAETKGLVNELKDLRDYELLVNKQRTWPRNNADFLLLAAMMAVIFLLPAPTVLRVAPPEINKTIESIFSFMPKALGEILHSLCDRLCG